MNSTATTRKLALVRTLLLCLAGGLSLGAHAGETRHPDVVRKAVAVNYADLDLSAPAGAKTLYARIRAAAQKVCGPEPGAGDLRAASSFDACYQEAVSKAVNRVGSDQLRALHAAHSGSSKVG
jgi:UrcA family protein